jgi:hypothetical protein
MDYDPLGVEGEPEVFLVITDSEKNFATVKDGQVSIQETPTTLAT